MSLPLPNMHLKSYGNNKLIMIVDTFDKDVNYALDELLIELISFVSLPNEKI